MACDVRETEDSKDSRAAWTCKNSTLPGQKKNCRSIGLWVRVRVGESGSSYADRLAMSQETSERTVLGTSLELPDAGGEIFVSPESQTPYKISIRTLRTLSAADYNKSITASCWTWTHAGSGRSKK